MTVFLNTPLLHLGAELFGLTILSFLATLTIVIGAAFSLWHHRVRYVLIGIAVALIIRYGPIF